ncbi:MAG: hypothetical protein GTN76_11560 [Candidatus Aenigmarchaeota archaeon]|nr:hypothetical protein [Candidatus Aenigmarchaeota archaeon]NIQ18065.1 hypothetical protein [Candidatus Aenigmarchaeota archaeon]
MNRKAIEKAIEEFNKYRSPEATVKLISTGKRSFFTEFTGPFCKTCGFYDYFEDFRLILEEKGLKTKTGKIKEKGEGAEVMFIVTG